MKPLKGLQDLSEVAGKPLRKESASDRGAEIPKETGDCFADLIQRFAVTRDGLFIGIDDFAPAATPAGEVGEEPNFPLLFPIESVKRLPVARLHDEHEIGLGKGVAAYRLRDVSGDIEAFLPCELNYLPGGRRAIRRPNPRRRDPDLRTEIQRGLAKEGGGKRAAAEVSRADEENVPHACARSAGGPLGGLAQKSTSDLSSRVMSS